MTKKKKTLMQPFSQTDTIDTRKNLQSWEHHSEDTAVLECHRRFSMFRHRVQFVRKFIRGNLSAVRKVTELKELDSCNALSSVRGCKICKAREDRRKRRRFKVRHESQISQQACSSLPNVCAPYRE